MRIISGRLKGRRFRPPMDSWPTRPTTDMAREALFNILQNKLDFDTTKALDLFGGTGSISLELYSRGSEDITFVENHRAAALYVKNTIEELQIEEAIKVVISDVYKFIEKASTSYDFIFADPPYNQNKVIELPDMIFHQKLLDDEGLLVIEHDRAQDFSSHSHFLEMRKYGKVQFSFFQDLSS